MKKIFYSGVLLFSFFIGDRLSFLLIRGLEKNIYKPKGADYSAILKSYMGSLDYDILILGTSRTQDGIHPEYIKETFGIDVYREADCGKFPMYNYYYYKMFKKVSGVPKLLIYGVDYFTFSSPSNTRLLARFPESQRRGYKDNLLSEISMLFSNRVALQQTINNLIIEFQQQVGGRYEEKLLKEFNYNQKYTGKPFNEGKMVEKEPEYYLKQPYVKWPGIEGGYFKKLMDQLKVDGVKVMLVILPDYYGTYLTNYQYDLYRKDLRDIADNYPNVELYDYGTPDIFPLKNRRFFRDGGFGISNSHLSDEGSRSFFLEYLKKDLDNIYRLKGSD